MALKHNKSQLTFDIGTPEEVFTCASCHPGGGPYEYDRDHRRLDSVDPGTVPYLDGDYYFYTTKETSQGTWGKPHKFDWRKTGSLEVDCMTCHLDPDAKRITDATGVKPVAYNPRLRIFAKRKLGKVQAVSLGIYPGPGWDSAFNYSDPLSRSKMKFEAGKFYSDLDNPMADSRNYLRAPYVEGQGFNYVGLRAKREFLGHFFRWAPSAGLMGWDNNQDGYPITYIKLVQKKKKFVAEVYYEASEFDADNEIAVPMLSSKDSENGDFKWTRVCAQCHAGVKDPINGSFQVRTWGMGMKADIVKRAEIWNLNPKTEKDPGYDVHAAAGLECTSCHARGKPAGKSWDDYVIDANHNFKKGHDSGNTVRSDLANNPPPKNCTYCHMQEGEGPNPTEAHKKLFGSSTWVHMNKIACEVCHVSHVRYWTFRTFDYSLGFQFDYDNRHFPRPDGKGIMNVMLPAYYGPIPFYGMGNISWLVGSMSYGKYVTDQLAPVAYMLPDKPDDPYGKMYQKMTGKKGFDWQPVLYYFTGSHGKQIMIGNPITVMTWRDKTMGKILYPREMNAAVKGIFKDGHGRYAQLITGEKIYDKTGFMGHPDMKPEISTLSDIRKMRRALITVLKKEGEANPNPQLYLAAHYFKVSHGVLPADQALGANGTCTVCHGENGKIENRIVSFTPNSIQGFNQGVKEGLILVDPEIRYVKPVDLNGDGKPDVLGAPEKKILKDTRAALLREKKSE